MSAAVVVGAVVVGAVVTVVEAAVVGGAALAAVAVAKLAGGSALRALVDAQAATANVETTSTVTSRRTSGDCSVCEFDHFFG